MTQVEAIYQNGVFKPVGEVTLPENQRVRLEVRPIVTTDFHAWLERVREHQQQIVAEYSVLPDSTPIIAEDRRRAAQ